jgi:hypothetical protein
MIRVVLQGTIVVSAGMVVRRAVPPLDVEMAIVPARSWRNGLERAGRFARDSAQPLASSYVQAGDPGLDQ